MTPCLSPEEFIDLLDDVLPAERRAHLVTCATCRATAADVRAALAAAERVEVPEPSPLFWPAVNARVRSAIAGESAASGGWRAWLRIDVLVPLAGLALVVVAIASAIGAVSPGGRASLSAPQMATAVDAPAGPAATETSADDALALMIDLAESLPEGGWDALGVTRLPDLDVAAASLTDEERDALTTLLQSAVERPPS